MFGELSLYASVTGVGLLVISGLFQDKIFPRFAEVCIPLGLAGLTVGVVLGGIAFDTLVGQWGLGIGATAGGLCGTAYLLYRGQTKTFYRVAGGDFEVVPATEEDGVIKPPAETEEGAGEGYPRPTPPSGPPGIVVRKTPSCHVTHISGYSFLHVILSGGDWRKRYRASCFVYVRGESNVDFYIYATGHSFWGLFTKKTASVRIPYGTYVLNLSCVDGCKIVPSVTGYPQRRDGNLVAGVEVTWDLLDSMDTIYVYITFACSMDSNLSISSNIGGGDVGIPSISANDFPTEMKYSTGTNVFKCEPDAEEGGISVG